MDCQPLLGTLSSYTFCFILFFLFLSFPLCNTKTTSTLGEHSFPASHSVLKHCLTHVPPDWETKTLQNGPCIHTNFSTHFGNGWPLAFQLHSNCPGLPPLLWFPVVSTSAPCRKLSPFCWAWEELTKENSGHGGANQAVVSKEEFVLEAPAFRLCFSPSPLTTTYPWPPPWHLTRLGAV